MTFNTAKCSFSQREIPFLGHIIGNRSIRPDPSRYQNLMDFPTPRTLAQLNRMIGLFAYYAKWLHNCSELTQSLTNSRATLSQTAILPDEAIHAIKTLKEKLVNACLRTPDFSLPLKIETDASDNALGATLPQEG